MSYTPQAHVAFGDMWSSGSHNTLLDNIAYLKSQTDLLFVPFYNNDAATVNAADPLILDPTYTAGLGLKMATSANDMRSFGVVVGASVSSHASGLVAIGGTIQNMNVTGTVVAGHALVTSATAHYAQDSGGGGWGPGVIAFALANQASGTGTIPTLVRPWFQFYVAAQSIAHSYGNNAVTSGATTTMIASAVSDGNNRLIIATGYNNNTINTLTFNSLAFTNLKAGANGQTGMFYLVNPTAMTANIVANYVTSGGVAIGIVLNGIHQTSPVGVVGLNSGSGTSISVIVTGVPGDLLIAGFHLDNNSAITGGRAAGQSSIQDISSGSYRFALDQAICVGSSFTFTWTVTTGTTWDAIGVATKTV